MTSHTFTLYGWMERAMCVGEDPELFFPDTGTCRTPGVTEQQVADAKTVCAVCPVSNECLEAAMREEADLAGYLRFGIRGGTTAAERSLIAARRTVSSRTADQKMAEIEKLIQHADPLSIAKRMNTTVDALEIFTRRNGRPDLSGPFQKSRETRNSENRRRTKALATAGFRLTSVIIEEYMIANPDAVYGDLIKRYGYTQSSIRKVLAREGRQDIGRQLIANRDKAKAGKATNESEHASQTVA